MAVCPHGDFEGLCPKCGEQDLNPTADAESQAFEGRGGDKPPPESAAKTHDGERADTNAARVCGGEARWWKTEEGFELRSPSSPVEKGEAMPTGVTEAVPSLPMHPDARTTDGRRCGRCDRFLTEDECPVCGDGLPW